MSKSYNEMRKLETFLDRFKYLKIEGQSVGEDTFGCQRYLNQKFYHSKEWRDFRKRVIYRDNGCDLGITGRDITGYIYLHHINPLTVDDVLHRSHALFDMNNVVCVSKRTHDAIHYGDESLLEEINPIERKPNDTCPWR